MPFPRIVLLRPRNADNLGAIARAMKNFGVSDWVVVSPNPKLLEVPGLNRLAVKAGDLLDSVRRVETLAEAVADCEWVVGTTMRLIDGRQRMTPRALAAEVATRAPGTWALVFGDERSGMSTDDLRQCHALSFIPSSDEQPSLNLAQAVLVYLYELAATARKEEPAPSPAMADDGLLRHLRETMELALTQVGFLRQNDRHAMDDLMRTLERSRLTKKEAGLWMAALKVTAKRSTDA